MLGKKKPELTFNDEEPEEVPALPGEGLPDPDDIIEDDEYSPGGRFLKWKASGLTLMDFLNQEAEEEEA